LNVRPKISSDRMENNSNPSSQVVVKEQEFKRFPMNNNQSSSGSMKTPEFSIGGLLANQFRKNQVKEGNVANKRYNESNKIGIAKDDEF
jgi:hypothetical protein